MGLPYFMVLSEGWIHNGLFKFFQVIGIRVRQCTVKILDQYIKICRMIRSFLHFLFLASLLQTFFPGCHSLISKIGLHHLLNFCLSLYSLNNFSGFINSISVHIISFISYTIFFSWFSICHQIILFSDILQILFLTAW